MHTLGTRGSAFQMTLREAEVVKHVSRALGALGYSEQVAHKGRGRPDIHVRNFSGHQFVVEAKGEGREHSREQSMDSSIVHALGQLSLRYTYNRSISGRHYGLAFPESFRRRVLSKLTPGTVRLFRLNIFFVTEGGKVTRLDANAVRRGLRSR
jgi:hypothetical protein